MTQTPADAPLPLLLGDPLRIRQILFNFASNAIKFSERGTVQLRLALEKNPQGWFLCGEVSDQGIGLTQAQIERLFEPFGQAETSTSRRYGGTGLGLAISHSLAQLLGGSVGVRSQAGMGSTFWFRICVHEAPPNATAVTVGMERRSASPDALQGMRALLVDDNALNRLVGSELLADAGIICDEAVDGQQAIATLEQASDGSYGVVLMDMMMPGLDGCATTRLLRQNPRFAQLPIIAMTANTAEEDIQACLEAGMQALIPKPVDADLLWNTLLAHCTPSTCALPREASPAEVGAQEAASPPQALPRMPPGFDLAAALDRLGHDRALYQRLACIFIDMFTAGADQAVAQVRSSWMQGDTQTARLHLHTLQGQAATLGAIALQACAANVHQGIKNAAPPAHIEAALEALEQRLVGDLAQLSVLVSQLARPAAIPAAIPGTGMA